ncbi:MAG: DUF2752 domain-containing protein [Spirosomataceae bacterium]
MKNLTLGVITIGTLWYYYAVFSATSIGIPCLFHEATGWYCPGCGGQRAFHFLLHGHAQEAAQYNLLIFIILPLLFIGLLSEFLGLKVLRLVRRPYVGLSFLVLLLLFAIVRNLHGFEFLTPP